MIVNFSKSGVTERVPLGEIVFMSEVPQHPVVHKYKHTTKVHPVFDASVKE